MRKVVQSYLDLPRLTGTYPDLLGLTGTYPSTSAPMMRTSAMRTLNTVAPPTCEIRSRYARDTPEIGPGYARDTPGIALRYARDMFRDMSVPRYARDMSEICPRYGRDMAEIAHLVPRPIEQAVRAMLLGP